MKKFLAAAALSLALLPGCATSNASDYFTNRGGDLVDCVRGHVMVGLGVSYMWEVTRFLYGGLDYENNVWAVGLGNRELGHWKESVFAWGLIVGHHDEKSIVGLDHDRLSGSYGWNFGDKGGNTYEMADPNNWLDVLTLRGTVMLGLGADLELRVGEVIDFIAGIFQFDPSGDDKPYSTLKTTANT